MGGSAPEPRAILSPIAPAPGPRRLTDAFIAAYLVVQVALPLGYYLGWRTPTDERFAWRMFSAVRLDRCEATLTVRDAFSAHARLPAKRPLRETLQPGWLAQLDRGQPRVVARVLARACEDEGAARATLTRRCTGAGGTEAPLEEDLGRACGPSP